MGSGLIGGGFLYKPDRMKKNLQPGYSPTLAGPQMFAWVGAGEEGVRRGVWVVGLWVVG